MTEPTTAVPLRGHRFDDDIEEFDNRLPNWWLWSFYLACIFAVGYWLHFHVVGAGKLPMDEYRAEMEAAAARAAQAEVTDASLLALAAEPAAVEQGRAVFEANCNQCHTVPGGPIGGGLVGPNLTDKYWLHGGSPLDMWNTVTKGVPAKGMPDYWERTLGRTRCMQVTAFVLSIKNTNVAGGKAPEGEPEQ
jgi:cytochrome c oxidase cbb3-type subunit 3